MRDKLRKYSRVAIFASICVFTFAQLASAVHDGHDVFDSHPPGDECTYCLVTSNMDDSPSLPVTAIVYTSIVKIVDFVQELSPFSINNVDNTYARAPPYI